ncbi:conserved hypothetical protein (plasmid) [Borreliella finlandensis]|uniref:Uncharacterized protein n=1 Tax=Borreliella finlandensis TaxID=498741 RepID=A0A806C593_9SPIR|nr:DUF735 family protein [Borreliella finlandensis]ACN93411.1 conserved hypothetical protein [Borreliella finlandensis]
MKISNFFKDTQVHKFMITENEYTQKLLNELKFINSNFISVDAKKYKIKIYCYIDISSLIDFLRTNSNFAKYYKRYQQCYYLLYAILVLMSHLG